MKWCHALENGDLVLKLCLFYNIFFYFTVSADSKNMKNNYISKINLFRSRHLEHALYTNA